MSDRRDKTGSVPGISAGSAFWGADALSGWRLEMERQFAELNEQGAAALEKLTKCQTPLDVLKVEQEWLAARSKSYFDALLRMTRLFATAANGVGAPARGRAHSEEKHAPHA